MLRGQRRKLPAELLTGLPADRAAWILRLTVILRLATLLNRGRVSEAIPALRWSAVELEFPEGWLSQRPLTAADLEQESRYLEVAGLDFQVLQVGSGGMP